MRLATVRLEGRTIAVRVDEADAVELGFPDVGAVLADLDWRRSAASATGPRHATATLDFAPVVPRPAKIICVGLNYRSHILEVGQPIPEYPTLFAKFAPTLIGAFDDIVIPAAVEQMDWEAELGFVVGAHIRHADAQRAADDIAGYTVVNDITARDWQLRTPQWLQGKTFAETTPVGPYLVTPDEAGGTFAIVCEVAGDVMQQAHTRDLVFGPAELVAYISTIMPLEPGDLVLTGTPGGVGLAQSPPQYLADGDEVVTRISGIGECRNVCRRG